MLFNGDYFDILLFCVMVALLLMLVLKRAKALKSIAVRAAGYFQRCCGLLLVEIKGRELKGFILDVCIQILVALFLCRGSVVEIGVARAIGVFLGDLLRVFGIYLLLLFITHIYFSFIRTYLKIGGLEKRVLRLITLTAIVIMERSTEGTAFTVAVFTIIIAFYYCLNMFVLFKTLGMAKQKTSEAKTIWRNVVGIIGMFIMLFSLLYYEVGAVVPGAFNRSITLVDSLYFTLITFATVGFGDIVATGVFTKLVTIVNALTSIACLVFLVNAIMGLTSGADTGSA